MGLTYLISSIFSDRTVHWAITAHIFREIPKNMAFTLNFSDSMFIIKARDSINQSAIGISVLLFS